MRCDGGGGEAEKLGQGRGRSVVEGVEEAEKEEEGVFTLSPHLSPAGALCAGSDRRRWLPKSSAQSLWSVQRLKDLRGNKSTRMMERNDNTE